MISSRRSTKSKDLLISLLLLPTALVNPVAAVSLQNIQPIAGFSPSCITAWIAPIPGCTVRDFTEGNSCSQSCLTGLTLIDQLVLEGCAGAEVSGGTLLADFLEGIGISILCSNVINQGTSTTLPPKTTRPPVTSTSRLTEPSHTRSQQTTAPKPTPTTTQTDPTPQATTSIDTTTSTSSPPTEATSTLPSTLEITFSGHTITSTPPSTSTTSSSTAATSTPGAEDQVFGGVGNAFNIIGNGSTRLKMNARHLLSLAMVLVATVVVHF